jgi:hypothetical protein
MKRCSISLVLREMQIRTIMRYYFTPIRMTTIKKERKEKAGMGVVYSCIPNTREAEEDQKAQG